MAKQSMRDRIREQAKNANNEGASYVKTTKKVHFFSPKADEYDLDIIPFENQNEKHPLGYEVGDLVPYVRFKVHAGIGSEDKKYICPTSIGKKCPICEERKAMSNDSNCDPDILKALAPKDRMLFNVIDLKNEKAGVQLFDHSYHLFGKRLLADIDKAENATGGRKRSMPHAGFAELDGGQTLIASFIEKKMGSNKFYECDRIDASDREDYGDSILDEALNLDECLKILDYDSLKAIFLEIDPEDQGSGRKREEKKEETPSRGRGRKEEAEEEKDETPPTRRRGKAEEKEEVVEEAPPTRRRGAKPPVEEVVEDVVEEAPPTRRRGAKSEPAPEPEKEAAPRSRSRGAVKEETGGKCWVEGGVFGKDCDTHLGEAPEPNCYDCPEDTWKACKEAQSKLK